MTPSECMRLLGLGEAASIEQIKRAYRRLAQQLHPDKQKGDPQASARFVEISKAYRMLVNAARAVEQGKPIGVCWECREFGEVSIGIDGQPRCRRCVFRPAGGRLLPLPVYVVVKCTVTCLILAVAVYLLVLAVTRGSTAYAIATFVAGILGLVSLAITCLSIVQCIHPRDRARQRKEPGGRP